MGISGHFTAQLIDAKSGRVKQELSFKNLITNIGLNTFMGFDNESLRSLAGFAIVGTGNSAPAFTDTALGNALGSTVYNGGIADVYTLGAANAYVSMKLTKVFVEAEVNGNLTELGMRSGANVLWCRQLFRDSQGNATTIVKTNQDQLKITYELRVNVPADVSGNVNDGTNNHAYTTRAAAMVSWTSGMFTDFGFQGFNAAGREASGLAAQSSSPVGYVDFDNAAVKAGYVDGTFYRDVKFSASPASQNYATGVGGIAIRSGGGYFFETSFTQKFAKTNTMRLEITYRIAFARA